MKAMTIDPNPVRSVATNRTLVPERPASRQSFGSRMIHNASPPINAAIDIKARGMATKKPSSTVVPSLFWIISMRLPSNAANPQKRKQP